MPSAPAWWAKRGLCARLLVPLAALFAVIAAWRRRLLRRQPHLPVPVIVVGNIAAGGSGKTPVVLALCARLQKQGWHPGIVSRGYGGKARLPMAVTAHSDPRQVGDEPVLLARRSGVPLWIGRDRVAAAQGLLAANSAVNCLVCDDGLQHYRLPRDIEIIVVDEAMLANGLALPAGPLREPVERLAEADLLIAHGPLSAATRAAAGAVPWVTMQLQAGEFYRLSAPTERCRAEALMGRRLKAVAGIGRPQRFFDTLASLGLAVQDVRAFPDHFLFREQDVALDGAECLLLTEKDAIKCAPFAPFETWVLPVDAHFADGAEMLNLLLERLHGYQTARNSRLPGV